MVRKILKLLSGPALGHLLTILLTPYFMSHYPPTQFGEYAFFIAMLGVFVSLSTLRFDAILLICENREVTYLIRCACGAALIMSSLIAFISYMVGYGYSIYLLSSLFALSLQLIVTSFFLREDKHSYSSAFNFLFIVMIPCAQWLFTHLEFRNGLLIGHALASMIYIIMAMPVLLINKVIATDPKNYIAIKEIRYLFIKYKSYYTFNAISVFINALSNQLLPISLKIIYGSEVLGFVNILQRLFITPVGFILRIIIQAYNREFSYHLRSNSIKKARLLFLKTISTSLIMASMVLISFCLFIIFKNTILTISFLTQQNSQWFEALNYAPMMLILLVFQILVIPVSQTLTFIDKHKLQLNIEIYRFISLVIVSLLFFYLNQSSYYYLMCYILVQSLVYVFLLSLINKYTRIEPSIEDRYQ